MPSRVRRCYFRSGRRGWHYEPTGDASKGTKVIEGTRSAPDAQGITEANVESNGVVKKARSSFFPKEWTPERVEREVMEAYRARQQSPQDPRIFLGTSSSGVKIEMRLDKTGRIQTAYPRHRSK